MPLDATDSVQPSLQSADAPTLGSSNLALLAAAPSALLAACGAVGSGSDSTALPPAPTPAGLTPEQASRFLGQAAWGANPSTLKALTEQGMNTWLTQQMAMPLSQSMTSWLIEKGYNDTTVSGNVNGDGGWTGAIWNKLFTAPDAFRQRAVLALSELFVVSTLGLPISWKNFAIANYWENLEKNVFGNFRSLLEAVTLSSAMGTYLNMKGNQKANAATGRAPDENYAREVLQLFTIGLYKLNTDGSLQLNAQGQPIETYDNNDIQGLAKVFTGWDLAAGTDPTGSLAASAYRQGLPMALNASLHSPEAKSFFGTVIPAGTLGTESLRIALDALFMHPNTAPFIAKQLIQRLVTSNPSAAYIDRVAKVFINNDSGVRGDMKAVWTAVLMDTQARASSSSTSFGKLREPMVRLVQWGRTFGATNADGLWTLGNTSAETTLNQMPLYASSVFNYFRPGYSPPNTALSPTQLVAPELQIAHEPSVVGYVNYMAGTVNNARVVKVDYSTEKALAATPAILIDHLNLHLAAGAVSAANRTLMTQAVTTIAATTDAGLLNRVYAAIVLVMSSNDYLIQQ
ncbi:DUF1800 domain-containing protein [Limnohabitans sp. Rim8]|uniref:DUF1800 domain-containing protein n=1 Tax=Limnohabitans sp. Rim8 TaxID=1100718 RepID=UPI003305722C